MKTCETYVVRRVEKLEKELVVSDTKINKLLLERNCLIEIIQCFASKYSDSEFSICRDSNGEIISLLPYSTYATDSDFDIIIKALKDYGNLSFDCDEVSSDDKV